MKKNIEDILNQIGQLVDSATMESIPVGDLATFTDGNTFVASVEDYADGVYTLRILAQAGDDFEPTDDVRKVNEDIVEPYTGDITGGEPDDIEEDDEVEFETEDGITKGVVLSIDGKAQVEVYALFEKGYEPTGVVVEHDLSDLTKTTFVKTNIEKKLMCQISGAKAVTDDTQGIIEGMLSSYGNVDLGGDTVKKGAYKQTIKHKKGKIKFFCDHWYGVKDLVGVAYLEDREDGLYMKGHVPIESESAKDAFIKAKFMIEHDEPLGLSIGYDTIKSKIMADGTRELQEIALHEASLTPFPMDTFALTLSAKSRKIGYQAKKSVWQRIKSDAPSGNQYTEGEIKSLLSEIKTEILNIRNK